MRHHGDAPIELKRFSRLGVLTSRRRLRRRPERSFQPRRQLAHVLDDPPGVALVNHEVPSVGRVVAGRHAAGLRGERGGGGGGGGVLRARRVTFVRGTGASVGCRGDWLPAQPRERVPRGDHILIRREPVPALSLDAPHPRVTRERGPHGQRLPDRRFARFAYERFVSRRPRRVRGFFTKNGKRSVRREALERVLRPGHAPRALEPPAPQTLDAAFCRKFVGSLSEAFAFVVGSR